LSGRLGLRAIIRASTSVLNAGPITCSLCGSNFEAIA
jgi:hypothetical protein